jgi:tRNA pseudouridine55 synthase
MFPNNSYLLDQNPTVPSVSHRQAEANSPTSHTSNGSILLVNKPLGWTSFDVVKKLRNILKVDKIGHAGTLDPLATGLLIICTGKQTKSIHQYQEMKKVYTGQLIIGKTTPSVDLETPFDSETLYDHITPAAIVQLAQTFVGEILQTPPVYSAIKIKGARAYEAARKGRQLALHPRPVLIEAFNIISMDLPIVNFEVTCSKGTYIRSLVRDMGKGLGVGAYMSQLCRTQIGTYALKDAKEIEQVGASN